MSSKPLYAAVEFGKRANGDIYRRDIRVVSGNETPYAKQRRLIRALVKEFISDPDNRQDVTEMFRRYVLDGAK